MPATPPVDATRLVSLLGRGSMWGPIEVVSSTGSTNADLVGRADVPAGLVRIADHQSAGRGRFDRSWVDAPGTAVAVSCVVRPAQPMARWGWLPLVAGMAVVEGLRDVCRGALADPQRVWLKWPNDVLLDDAKVCGILAQVAGGAVVIGWGVNVSMDAAELPVESATSLLLADLPTDKTALVASILASLARHYDRWQAGSVRDDYRGVSTTLGRPVRVVLADGSVEGIAVDVDTDGALLVDVPGAGVRAFPAGDVVHLRGFGADW